MNLRWIRRNYIDILLLTTLFLLIFTATFTILNKETLDKNLVLRKQVVDAKKEITFFVDETLRHIDVGIRGYAIIHDRRYVYMSSDSIKRNQEKNNVRLDSILALQHYNNPEGLETLRDFREYINEYIIYFNDMLAALDKRDTAEFKRLFYLDKGAAAGKAFSKAKEFLFQFEDALDAEAILNYKTAMARGIYLQIILLLIGMPCLFLAFVRLRRERVSQLSLLNKLEATNRKYLFDPGKQEKILDTERVVEETVKNLQYASNFVAKISEGDYSQNWQGMTEENIKLNTENLAGKIISLQKDLLKIKTEEGKRYWANEGFALFAEVLRTKNGSIEELGENVLKQVIAYMKANQGAFYVINDDNDNDQFIEMVACYAYDRKKFLTRRINIGEGLIGETVLEGNVTVLKDVPKSYLSITSGLGMAEPKFLVIIPIKAEEKVYGVLEIASFQIMQDHEIKFLERIAQSIASAVSSAKANLKTQNLLHETQQQTERLKVQEEQMRQNMEELQAIQEQIERDKRSTK